MLSTAAAINDDSRKTESDINPQVFPPGPKSSFFGLKLHVASRRDPLGFMERLAHEYGDVVRFTIGRRPVFLLNHPEHVKGVLLSHYANFTKGRGIVRRNNFLGEGLLTSEGTFHRRQRQSTKPAFDHERLFGYGDTMTRLAAETSDSWRHRGNLDVLQTMRKLTLPIASQTLFGTSVEKDHQRIIAAFGTGLGAFRSFKSPFTQLADRFALTQAGQLRRARLDLESMMSRIIAERRSDAHDRGDLLSLLMSRAPDEDERLRADDQIRDEAITLFIGGFENIATTLSWTWYLLAQHPEVEAKLHRELDGVLGGRLPTAADLPQLRYTRMVLEESMRVYPPVPRLVRTAIRNYEVGSYMLPAGALVVVSQYLMHRDSRYYPEPLRFDPERWTSEARAMRPAYSYFPFGGGPRRCIGEGFAYLEGILLLATLASRWRLSLTSQEPIGMIATHFLHPRGTLTMKVENRGT